MVIEVKKLLVVDVGSALAAVDTPLALAALEGACGGKIRGLMQTSPRGPMSDIDTPR